MSFIDKSKFGDYNKQTSIDSANAFEAIPNAIRDLETDFVLVADGITGGRAVNGGCFAWLLGSQAITAFEKDTWLTLKSVITPGNEVAQVPGSVKSYIVVYSREYNKKDNTDTAKYVPLYFRDKNGVVHDKRPDPMADNQTLSYDSATGELTISDGNTVIVEQDANKDYGAINRNMINRFYWSINSNDINANGDNITKIACLGDSITEGNGADPGMDYPAQLQSLYRTNSFCDDPAEIIVYNYGLGGDTWKSAYERLDTLDFMDVDVVIVMLGTNDYNNVVARYDTHTYAKLLIEKLIDIKECAVILVTPHRWGDNKYMVKASNSNLSDYVSFVEELGKTYQAPTLNLFHESKNLNPTAYKTGENMGVHFSTEGYIWLASKIYAFMGLQHPDSKPVIGHQGFLGVRFGNDGFNEYFLDGIGHIVSSYNHLQPRGSDPMALAYNLEEGDYNDHFVYNVHFTEDDMVLIPSFTMMEGGYLKIYINKGTNVQDYSNYTLYDPYTTDASKPIPSQTLVTNYGDQTNLNGQLTQSAYTNFLLDNPYFYYRVIPSAGWHSIYVEGHNCRFMGFDCISATNFCAYMGRKYVNQFAPTMLLLDGEENKFSCSEYVGGVGG